MTKVKQFEPRAQVAAPLRTPTDLSRDALNTVSAALNAILADSFALYLKTKNFHWHVSGPRLPLAALGRQSGSRGHLLSFRFCRHMSTTLLRSFL